MHNQQTIDAQRNVNDVMQLAVLNTVLQVERQARDCDRVRLVAIVHTLRQIARR